MSEAKPRAPQQANTVLQIGAENGAGDEENAPILAVIYARVSSPNQRFNYSLDEQVERCWERCNQMGWRVGHVFKEEESGGTTDRPKFRMMMDLAREGAFDVIVVWKIDRFCWSLINLLNVEGELRKLGVALHSVTEQIDTTAPIGRFNFRNLASAAELERDLIKERTRMGMHALAREHRWPNSFPPLGYDKRGDERLEVNEEEAALVRRIFLMYIDRRPMPQIAFELNQKGISTKRGKRWSAWSVKKVLDNRLYVGDYSVAGVNDHVEEYRILDDGLFEKVHEIREQFRDERREMPEDRRKAKIDRVFNEYLKFLDEMEDIEHEAC